MRQLFRILIHKSQGFVQRKTPSWHLPEFITPIPKMTRGKRIKTMVLDADEMSVSLSIFSLLFQRVVQGIGKEFVRGLGIFSFALSLSACKDTGERLEGWVADTWNRSTLSTSSLSATITEGNANTFVLILDHAIKEDADLSWSINAPAGVFSATSGVVHFNMGDKSQSLQIDALQNTTRQGNLTYQLTLSGAWTVFTNSLTIDLTVIDDESPPVLSIANASVTEGTGAGSTNLSFTVTASFTSSSDITVDYATSNGTAVAGSDYTATTGTLTIPAGSTTGTISVPINRDSVSEGSETLTMTLSGGSGYTTTGSTLTATGTIVDDDGTPTLSIADVTVTEGTGAGTINATLTITASGVSASNITVDYATSSGTATSGTDFTATSGTATITAGATTTTFSVPITRDALHENNETFTVTLSGGAGYTSSGSTLSATGTITDDDAAPTISIANVSLTEGNSGSSNLTFTVTASSTSGLPITVNYATSDGTATAGSDYTTTSGTATIAAGSTTTTINVPVLGDTLYENDETLTMTLSGGSGYTSAGSTLTATGTITNDDTAPTISIANVTVVEGTGAGTTSAVFTITASTVSGAAITVNYATSSATATSGTDFTATTGTATIAAGSTTTTLTVPVAQDSTYEPTETYTVTLSSGSGYTSAGSTLTATGTITDDDTLSQTWNFASSSDYTFDSNYINFTSGNVTLKTVNTTFNDATTFNNGTHVGTVWSGGVLKLKTSDNSELSATNGPAWGNLLGYWRLNETSWNGTAGEIIDSSGNNNNGTAVNGATTVNGYIGKMGCFARSSSKAVAVPNSPSLVSFHLNSFTFAAWVLPTGVPPHGQAEFIVGRNGFHTGLNINAFGSSGYFSMRTYLDDNSNLSATSTVPVVLGRLYHVVGLVDYSVRKVKLYVDGTFVISTDIPSGRSLNPLGAWSTLGIGGIGASGSEAFDGCIDEVGLWNTALTEGQISALYSLQAPTAMITELSPTWTPKWSNIVGYWKMDGNWLDSSGNGDYLSSTSFDIGGMTKISFFAWAKHSLSVPTDQNVVAYKSDTGFELGINNSGSLNLYTKVNGTWMANIVASAQSDWNSWHHVGFTYDGTTLKLYRDGSLVGSAFASGSMVVSNNPLYIGLRSCCGTAWPGSIDDVALFSSTLSSSDISLIYNRQKQKYAGSYDSPVLDMGATASWTSLSAVNSLPFYKELPGSSGNESSTFYSNIQNSSGATGSGSSLDTGLVALWHFDENSWNGTTGEVTDSSGNANHGTRTGNATTTAESRFSKAGFFSSSSDSVVASASSNYVLSGHPVTLTAWIHPYSIATTTTVDNRILSVHYGSVPGSTLAFGLGNTNKLMFYNQNDSATVSSINNVQLATWTFAVLVYNGACFQMFINGHSDGSCHTANVTSGGSYALRIGSYNSSSYNFNGIIDEVAIWSRALTPAEVLELYRRGANRVKYQVRSCIDTTCACKAYSTGPAGSASDCDGDGTLNASDTSDAYAADWIGPDGTGTTYFSELQNNTSVDASGNPTGSVNTTGFNLNWSATGGLSNIMGKPTNNRYFQYRVYMESDDENNLCSSAPCMPEVSSITVGPTGRYYGGSPGIVNNTTLSASQLFSMTRSDSGTCTKYQISIDDGATWKWWDGTANAGVGGWVTATATEQSNYLSDYDISGGGSRLTSLGAATFKFKALLKTNVDFTQPCSLSSVGLTYTP